MTLAQFCVDLRDWIKAASQYAPIISNGFKPYLCFDDEGNAVLRLLESPLSKMTRHQAESLVVVLIAVAKEIMGRPEFYPKVVRFYHARPNNIDFHKEIFKCDLEFSSNYSEIVFNREYLDEPVCNKLNVFRRVVDAYIKCKMRGIFSIHSSFIENIAMAVELVIGTELCTAENVANSLGMSEKKMQRLLRDEGMTFRAILLEVRRRIAHRMLVDTNVPIDIVGGCLGYGSSSAFTLAFTNWAGEPPSAYRSRHQIV